MAKALIKKGKVNAGLFKRVTAFALDILVLNLVVVLPFRRVISKLIPTSSLAALSNALKSEPTILNQLNGVYLTIGLLSFLYFTVSEYKLGQSLGKMLMGIYVNSETASLSLWQVSLRNLFIIPLFPFTLLWIVDPLALLFTKGKHRVSDIISKTCVIQYETRIL